MDMVAGGLQVLCVPQFITAMGPNQIVKLVVIHIETADIALVLLSGVGKFRAHIRAAQVHGQHLCHGADPQSAVPQRKALVQVAVAAFTDVDKFAFFLIDPGLLAGSHRALIDRVG